MSDIINKIIAVILAFVILVFGPMTIVTYTQDLTMQRGVLNKMSEFIDKVCTTGAISDKQLEAFYLDVSSFGYTIDAKINRYVPVNNPNADGSIRVSYMPASTNNTYNTGDIVQIKCKAIDLTGPQKMVRALLSISQQKFDVTLSNMVR